MSNNHILDFGQNGLADTIKAVESKSIDWVGVGANSEDARRVLYKDIKGKKVAFIAVCEKEESFATETSAGANFFDPFDTIEDIESARENADVVIVLYHGGKEYVHYPSPNLQKICRSMVKRGADYVICQHSHCVGCYEKFQGGHIVYGQGNFIFDHSEHPMWQTGLLLKLLIGDTNEIEFIPLVKKKERVDAPEADIKNKILDEFHARSSKLADAEFLAAEWKRFCLSMRGPYLHCLRGSGRIFSGVDRKILGGRLLKRIYNKRRLCTLHDFLVCDAHLDVLRTFLEHDYKNE
jgi:hypothetical protein